MGMNQVAWKDMSDERENKMSSNQVLHIIALVLLAMGLVTSLALATAEDQPFIVVVNLPTNMFRVYGYPLGTNVITSADNPSTPGVDFSGNQLSQPTGCDFWGSPCAVFLLPDPLNLEAFWTIAATDGVHPIQFLLAEVKLTGWNLQGDTLNGTVQPWNPGIDEVRFAMMKPQFCASASELATTDPNGNWLALLTPCDLVEGAGGALNYFNGQNKLIGSWGVPVMTPTYLPVVWK